MELQTWFLYTLAAVGLSLTPGPNGLLALTMEPCMERERPFSQSLEDLLVFQLLSDFQCLVLGRC